MNTCARDMGKWSVVLGLVGAVGLWTRTADSVITFGASSGHAYRSSEVTCFQNGPSQDVTNPNCGTRYVYNDWEIPLPREASSTVTYVITVKASNGNGPTPSPGNVACWGVVTDSGGGTHTTSTVSTTGNAGWQTLSLGSITATPTSALEARCTLTYDVFVGGGDLLQAELH